MRILTAGESHGKALVAIIDGLPSGIEIDIDYINFILFLRKNSYGRGSRMKIEADEVEIISGIRKGLTIGSPLSLIIKNKDTEQVSKEIEQNIAVPSHADFAGAIKYGFSDVKNVWERASARETAIQCAVGAIAIQILEKLDIHVVSTVNQIGTSYAKKRFKHCTNEEFKKEGILSRLQDRQDEYYQTRIYCFDIPTAQKMKLEIDNAKKNEDSLGGSITSLAIGVPIGLGSYSQYDKKLDGKLAQALMNINSVKGVEFGAGNDFDAIEGSFAIDEFYNFDNKIQRRTNKCGGIEGGVSNGEPIIATLHIKPIPTIKKQINSINLKTLEIAKSVYRRSDVCAVPAICIIARCIMAIEILKAVIEEFSSSTFSELRNSTMQRKKYIDS